MGLSTPAYTDSCEQSGNGYEGQARGGGGRGVGLGIDVNAWGRLILFSSKGVRCVGGLQGGKKEKLCTQKGTKRVEESGTKHI